MILYMAEERRVIDDRSNEPTDENFLWLRHPGSPQRGDGVTRSFKEQESTSANFLLPCNPGGPARATLRLEWTNMDLVNGIEDIERDNSVES